MRFSYLLVAILLFSGCGDKKEKTTSKEEVKEIKITENVVEKEKKVENKENSGQFYYSYNKKQKDTIEDEDRYTKLGAYRHVRSPYEKVQISLLANKLSKNFILHCSPCHDDYANGIIGPSLLDKSGEFIYKQLLDFKQNKRKNVLMVELVKRIDDKTLKELADEIADFNQKVKKITQGKI